MSLGSLQWIQTIWVTDPYTVLFYTLPLGVMYDSPCYTLKMTDHESNTTPLKSIRNNRITTLNNLYSTNIEQVLDEMNVINYDEFQDIVSLIKCLLLFNLEYIILLA